MSDEQIKSMMDSYFIKSRIVDFAGPIVFMAAVIFISSILLSSPSEINKFIFIFVYLIANAILFYSVNKIKLKLIAPINAVLEDDCDFESYKKLIKYGYQEYYDVNIIRKIMIHAYIRICDLDKDSEKIKELMNDNVFIRFNKRNKIYLNYLDLIIAWHEKNELKFSVSYQCLIDKIRKKRGSKFEKLKKELDFLYFAYDGDYKQALDILNDTKLETNISQVLIAFNKGLSLNKLERNDEAIEQLNYVIENGNTLPQVERAKKLLLEISE
ncbi:hypothetical protein [Breznakia pachnodae]|uniref:Tetratricopeptide repeat protein n=1 Tax=Breznakia pachnodae TaxID=265178 RepID=A0ABU0E337_9FIRM|nr:hypothetical protein [Breznakia pachnodae]MDQ0361307.1 hypothetical protein [Breznakia pachnodae]